MVEWWMSLGSAGQVFACIAIPATLILFLQMILTIIGFGGDEAQSEAQYQTPVKLYGVFPSSRG